MSVAPPDVNAAELLRLNGFRQPHSIRIGRSGENWQSSAPVDLFSDILKKPPKALTVSQLVRKMKRAVEAECGKLWIEGEVSNLKRQGSGHWYFSLKDEGSQIQCAIFGARNREGTEVLEDGAKVRVFADATVYLARGQLQIIVEKVEPSGAGDLQAEFEALKRKLAAEGLFEPSRRKPLPAFPKTIGIVTSPTGAAIQDILNILARRAPWVTPILYPVRVQGKGAELEIAGGIRHFSQPGESGHPPCDLVIVGRGGGSIEDLWCFNEEVVARAIVASEVPVISAVGHEVDFTIADFVADLRAPTPSAAAELAVPDILDLRAGLSGLKTRLIRSMETSLRESSQRLDLIRASLLVAIRDALKHRITAHREMILRHRALHPLGLLDRRLEQISAIRKNLRIIALHLLDSTASRLRHLGKHLRTLGPESAFERGFSITIGPDGGILRSTTAVSPGGTIRTRLLDGEFTSIVSK